MRFRVESPPYRGIVAGGASTLDSGLHSHRIKKRAYQTVWGSEMIPTPSLVINTLAEYKSFMYRLGINKLPEFFSRHLEADTVEPVGNAVSPLQEKQVVADTAE